MASKHMQKQGQEVLSAGVELKGELVGHVRETRENGIIARRKIG